MLKHKDFQSFLATATALVFLLSLPSIAHAKKCTRVIPMEIFEQYGVKKKRDVDCGDYFFQEVDLNGDGVRELIVRKDSTCHRAGYCNYDIFQKSDKNWNRIARIPGRPEFTKTKTDGYCDLACWSLGFRYLFVWDGDQYRDYSMFGRKGEINIRTPPEQKKDENHRDSPAEPKKD